MALYWPVDAPVTQQFATNPNDIQPNGHTGIDFAVNPNTPIKSAGAGTVVWEGWATRLSANNVWWIAPAYAGICVVIDHGNGILSLYGHLNETHISVNDKVAAGQVIGLSGSTGLSSGPHLHFELLGWPLQPYNGFYGRVNPHNFISSLTPAASVTLKPNQRIVGSEPVNIRSAALTTAPIIGQIPADRVQTFEGYVVGEMIQPYNVWYKGTDGYVWSGGFTEAKMDGLPNLTPPPLNAFQRQVGPDNVNIRKEPSLTAEIIAVAPANSIQTMVGYGVGDYVDEFNVWYKGTTGYAHCIGFTTQEIGALPHAPVPVVVPPVVTPPAAYSFTKDFDFVEYIPAAINNLERTRFPAKPPMTVIHQFGKPGVDTLNSLINTFTNNGLEKPASAHFAVSGKRIIQMVSLKDRAYHAGKIGNDYIGIETDPAQDADTIASTKKLLKALKEKYGYEFPLIRHKDVDPVGNPTSCGTLIDLSKYSIAEVVTPPVTQPPVTVPLNERAILEKFAKYLIDEYLAKQ